MLGLDKLGPGSILVVLIAGGWLTAWAEWARVRVAVQACGCLVTLAGLWRSGIMVRLGPRPDVLTGPAGTRGKWEMSSWSRGVRSATPGWSGSRGR